MKKCDVCQLTFEEGMFCNKCGGALVDFEPEQSAESLVCAYCGTEGNTGKFCGKCGQPLAQGAKGVEELIQNKPEQPADILGAVAQEQEVEKKACEACGYAENTSKFCAKCGHVLGQPYVKTEVIEPTESKASKKKEKAEKKSITKVTSRDKKVKSEKTSSDASKPKVKLGKMILIAVLIAFVAFVGITAFYLNQSQVEAKIDREFESESYFNTLRLDEFDGLNLAYNLKDEQINYILEAYVDTEVQLPLGLKITDLFYKNSQINVQLDNGFIHTTAIIDASLKFENKQLVPMIEQVAIGDKKIVLPVTSYIESSEVLKPINCPVYLEDVKVNLKDTSIKYEVTLDKEYFYSLLEDGYNTYSHDRSLVLEAMGLKDVKSIDGMKEKISDKSDEDLKDFLYKAINKEEFFASYLYLIEPAKADEIIDTFIQDTIYLDGEQTQKMKSELEKLRSELDDAYEEMSQKILEDKVVENGDMLFKHLRSYLNRNSYKDIVFSYEKRPYSSQGGNIITATTLMDYKYVSLDSEMDFELLYFNNQYYLAIEAFGQCYFVKEGKILSEFDSKIEALKHYDVANSYTIKSASLLHRGNKDRAAIAETVSDYVYSDNSMFINYLKSDGEWAYLIGSPGNYSQSASQYILKKYGSQWKVVQSFSEYDSFGSEISSSLINEGFNVTVLPNFDMSNYDRWYCYYDDIDTIVSHLKYNDKISYSDEMNYFSRVDDILVVTFESGKRFIFVFVMDNQYEYEDLYELSTDESYTDYDFIFDYLYNDIAPTYVFIQD